MWKKSSFLLTFFMSIFVCMQVHAQIFPNSTHYMINPQVKNPAFYGHEDGITFGGNFRYQWAKLEGQPRTFNFFADANLPAAHGAVGLNVSADMLGAYTITTLNAGYNFIQPIKNKIKICIGLNAGVVISQLDESKLTTPESTDDDLNSLKQKSLRPNLTVGIALQHKFVDVGFAYSNLINFNDKFKGQSGELKTKYGNEFHAFVQGKLLFKDYIALRPSISFYTDFKEFQTDLSILAGYTKYGLIGINVRGFNKKTFESISPVINITAVKNLNIVYSYDLNLNKLAKVNKGTHEITLKYTLPNSKIYKQPKIINNPRFL
ncbi:MAG TPA: type IX secretion system membrane protein PorP/SprF [Chitinophagales bacterium]|nr:type IX secretion system membrane protein PorP/SprF [Chitinophagales bacterium]